MKTKISVILYSETERDLLVSTKGIMESVRVPKYAVKLNDKCGERYTMEINERLAKEKGLI